MITVEVSGVAHCARFWPAAFTADMVATDDALLPDRANEFADACVIVIVTSATLLEAAPSVAAMHEESEIDDALRNRRAATMLTMSNGSETDGARPCASHRATPRTLVERAPSRRPWLPPPPLLLLVFV